MVFHAEPAQPCEGGAKLDRTSTPFINSQTDLAFNKSLLD